jgi:hypothetical protein
MFVHAVLLTPHARFLRSKINHNSANSNENQGPRGYCLMKKTAGRKTRDSVPLSYNPDTGTEFIPNSVPTLG